MIATPRFAPSTLAALLVAVTALTASRALGAPAARHTTRQPVSRASSAAPVVPIFESHIVGKIVPGKRAVWRMTRIVVLLAGSAQDEILTVDCLGCRGNQLGAVRRRGRKASMVTNLLVTGQSRLVIYVRRAGWVGRFKVYTLRPRLRAHRLIEQGCLAVDVYTPVSCSPSTRVEYVGPGTAFGPSCPTSCLAVTRVTGYQETTGGLEGTSIVRAGGYLTAWQIALGKPTSQQTSFFEANEGGPAEASVAVLRPEPPPRFAYRLIAQSPPIKLAPYFGRVPQFTLEQPLKVEAGDVIALTVPTWAPALALGFSSSEATWRSSRQNGQCSTTSTQSSDTQVGSTVRYACRYEAAQLAYDAIVGPSP